MAIWRCTLTWKNTTDGGFGQNVLHFLEPTDQMLPEQVGALLDQQWWGSAANPALDVMTSNNTQLDSMTVQRIVPDPAQGLVPVATAKRLGQTVSNNYHHVVGMIFQLRDGLGGRAHRGRVYHYGSPSVNQGLTRLGPGAGTVTNFNTLRTRWLTRFGENGTSGLRWVIWHRGQQGNARWSHVSDIILAPVLGVQRRRNPHVGL